MRLFVRIIPSPLVRLFASPYVAGDSLQKAMDAAASAYADRGVRTTLDLLAEDIDGQETVQRNIDTYLRMADASATDPRFDGSGTRPTLSLKLSSYTTAPLDRGGDAAGAREAVFQIADHAQEKGVGLTIDMEGLAWTDFTLQTLDDLHRAGYRDVGAVLQTRLHRTEADLDRLPEGCRVRLVIGIYQEPEEVATTRKAEMKQRMLEYAGVLLRRGHYVEFATHDEAVVKRFLDEVVPATGATTDRFEVQMLYGVPRTKLLAQLVQRGVTARRYIPFALSWPLAIQYLRRRLDEYPQMMFLVLRNLLLRR
ncbi:MAG: proline dehydrogenase family protein [Planctomycetota bacterium]